MVARRSPPYKRNATFCVLETPGIAEGERSSGGAYAVQDLYVAMSGDDRQSTYREALAGLIELLGLVGENSWRDVLAKHLDDWTRARDVRPISASTEAWAPLMTFF